MAVTVRRNRHLRFIDAPDALTWQAGYDHAYATALAGGADYSLLDAWFDANTGRTSTEDLLDLGVGQFTVTTSVLNARAVSDPAHFFQTVIDFPGLGEVTCWVMRDVMASNLRITSTGLLPLLIEQSYFPRRGATYNYTIHSPTTSPVHNIWLRDSDLDGEEEPSGAFAVYMPANNYVDDDTVVERCRFRGFQSCVRGVYGTTMRYSLIEDQYYFEGSHNTAASFRGGHSRAERNRVRPGPGGASGINFYAEVSPGNSPTGYDFIYCEENAITAPNAAVTVQFPDEDDPSILFSDPFAGMTRLCRANIIDQRFSNPLNWVPPGGAIGTIFEGSGIAENIHTNGTDADDGSLP